MTSSCPLGPSLACSAMGQYWMSSKTWIASPPHTYCSKCNKTLTLPQRLRRDDNQQGHKRTRPSLRLSLYQGHTWGERIHSYQSVILSLSAVHSTQRRNSHNWKHKNFSCSSMSDKFSVTFWCSAGFLDCLAYSPYLSVGGWSLSDDGAGLRRGQGLLDHYAGIMVAHPWVGLLVLALACLAVQWDVLQRGRKANEYTRLEICQECHILHSRLHLKHNSSITTVWMSNEELCKLSSTGFFWVEETLKV